MFELETISCGSYYSKNPEEFYYNYYKSPFFATYNKYLALLICYRRDEIPPLTSFEGEYELALLDLARVVVGEHWAKATPEGLEARRGQLTFAAYNKCPRLACCLMRRVADAVDRYEGGGDG